MRPGKDGGGVDSTAADSAFDVAFFSSGARSTMAASSPTSSRPDTHVTGTRSRADGYTGDGVCATGFPGDATRFTWSSGTSHAAPAVSGAAALLYAYLGSGARASPPPAAPSPALIKAWLLNSTRYLTGAGGGDDLPSPRQGWGLLDLERALDDAPRVVTDRAPLFVKAGQTHDVFASPPTPRAPCA